MANKIGGVLIFVTLIAFVVFVYSLYTLGDISIYKSTNEVPNNIFTSLNLRLDCIKTTLGVSFVVFVLSLVFCIRLLKKNDD